MAADVPPGPTRFDRGWEPKEVRGGFRKNGVTSTPLKASGTSMSSFSHSTNAPSSLTRRERNQRVVAIFERGDGRFYLQPGGVEVLIRAGASLRDVTNRVWRDPADLIRLCHRWGVFFELVPAKRPNNSEAAQ